MYAVLLLGKQCRITNSESESEKNYVSFRDNGGLSKAIDRLNMGIGQIRRHIGDANLAGNN